MLNQLFLFKRYSAVFTALCVFIIYLFTLAPSVTQIDSGELASVQKTLGIAHPTGYPLFTIIGYLFLKIPFPATDIYKANLLAAIWCSLGVYLFIKTAQFLLTGISSLIVNNKLKNKNIAEEQKQRIETIKIILPSVLGGIVLAFSKTFWLQSTSVEVYSLQIFLFISIIYTTLQAYFSKDNNIFWWIWTAIALAFGFANHMTTILILPMIAILFFAKNKLTVPAFKRIVVMLTVFFPLLILFYSYLPIRASANPEINWGNVVNLENFWRHFTGKQYQVWLFESFDSAKKQFIYYVENLPSEIFIVNLGIILLGIISSYKFSKIIFHSFIITFIFSVLYSINYDIVDIDSYFLLSFIILCFFSVIGFQRILSGKQKYLNYAIAVILLSLTAAFQLLLNYNKTDQSDIYTFEDYTLSILKNTDPNSIIFSYQWDYFISPSYYFQFAEGIRKDIAVIDKELLRRSWYYNQINRSYPDVIKNIKPDIKLFLEALRPFERDENFDPNLLEKYFRTIMTKLVSENAGTRSFYIGLELIQNEMQSGEFSLPPGYQIVPDLLMFKVVKGNDYVPAKDPDFRIRIPVNGNKYTENIKRLVCTVLLYRVNYELFFGKNERAALYINKIKNDFPDFQIPHEILARIN